MAGLYFSAFPPLINVFTRLHTKPFSHFPLQHSDILSSYNAHHLNSQLLICQHVETPLKCLHAMSEEIGSDLDTIIISVGRLLVAQRVAFYVIPEI